MQRFTPRFALRCAIFGAGAATIAFLTGCATNPEAATTTTLVVPVSTGSVHGGQQPIVGAHVYLYAASTSGYGSQSISKMTLNASGTSTDGNNNAYVTTDSNGNFTYGGKYTCTTGQQLYLLALGGNPGGSSANSAISLAATVGECSTLNSSTHTFIDEVTTVGMAYALKAFMVDPTHVGTSSTNVNGLAAAFATVNNLVNNSTGVALATTPAGNGVAPQQYVNSLANIIASCVNSSSPSSTPCSDLFTYTTVTTTPQDTLSALISIAAFPGTQTANLYGIASAIAPFQPGLTSQPNDFSLGITYSPVAVTAVQPNAVVIDAAGNIWMANCKSCLTPTAPDSLLEFSSTGTFLHSYTGSGNPSTQVLHGIKGIAIDATGSNIYTVNQGVAGGPTPGTGDDQVIKMSTSTGAVQAGFPLDFDQGTYGVDTFNGIALDNSGELWATAGNTGAIVQFNPSGNLINGSPIFIGGTTGVATDNIGNIWFAGTDGDNILQFDTNADYLNNFTPAGLNQPVNMAINSSNELLTINNGTDTLSKVEFFNGNNGSGSPYSNLSIYQASVTAVDGSNQILIPNCRTSCGQTGGNPDNLIRLSTADTPNMGGGVAGAQSPGFRGASGAAIDASGNVWVANSVSGTLTQVVGFAAPTIQPIAAASTNGDIGQLP